MSAIDPAGEKIAKNLQQAVEQLQHDIARVELWAGALGCFARPIPDYGHGRTKFDLPAHAAKSDEGSPETDVHRIAGELASDVRDAGNPPRRP